MPIKTKPLFTFFLLFAFVVQGQNGMEMPATIIPNDYPISYQYRVDYPIGVNGETFFIGGLEHRISKRIGIRIENFYARFGTNEQISTALLFKWYMQKKLYLLAGTQCQYGTNQFTGEQELLRVNLNLRVGYEVDEDFLLEMGYHPEIGSPREDLMGRPIPRQNTFSLRASF
ncbi:MAG: hypothetical protein AAF717_04190 [Bacteroidota bacterium]